MTINYTAKKVTLKDNFKERVEKKLKKFERIFGPDVIVNVLVTVEKNRQKVEVTIKDNGLVYRAENTTAEMNDAIDKVVDILGRQIRKNKSKLQKRMKSTFIDDYISTLPETTELSDVEDEVTYEVVRTKRIPVKPLTVDEAILQMNMVDHKFFMFFNADTEEMNVVYLRNDGAYGLLVPNKE